MKRDHNHRICAAAGCVLTRHGPQPSRSKPSFFSGNRSFSYGARFSWRPSMANPIPRRGTEVLQRGTQVLQRETQVLQLHLRRNFRSAVAAHVCSRLLLLSGMSGQAVPKIGQAVPNGDLWPGMSCQECQLLPVVSPAAQITTVGRQHRVFPRCVRFVELPVSSRAHLPRGVPSSCSPQGPVQIRGCHRLSRW